MSEEQAAAVEEIAPEALLPDKAEFMQGEERSAESDDPAPLTEVEQKAHDMGWRPLEEYEGDEDQWVDAKEFVGRAPLYEGLSKQSKKIKTMEKMLETLTEQNKRIAENAKKEALLELKQQRIQALDEGDAARAVELEDKARELEAEPVEDANEQGGETAKFKEWREENSWFDDDLDLRIYANGYGQQLYQASPEMSEEDLYAKVTEKVKEVFPEKFGKKSKKLPNRGNPSGGQGAGRARGGNNKFNLLTPEQKKMCREFVAQGLFTEESYIKSLEDSGMIKEAQ